jgi:hypothetical protein
VAGGLHPPAMGPMRAGNLFPSSGTTNSGFRYTIRPCFSNTLSIFGSMRGSCCSWKEKEGSDWETEDYLQAPL